MSFVSTSGSTVVLVTGPQWNRDNNDDGVVEVEKERCQTIRVSGSDDEHRRRLVAREESNFGGEERELEERPISIISPCDDESAENLKGGGAAAAAANFDVCREYGYKYEYTVDDDDNDDDDDDDNNLLNPYDAGNSSQPAMSSSAPVASNDGDNDIDVPIIYLLGKYYHSIHDYAPRRDDETSLFWFTYRCDFPEIVPYRITSDAGWGCMLRSAQMLLAHALRMHYQSGNREWRPPKSMAARRNELFLRNLLTWFADFPSADECFYSLHNMVAAGLAKYEKLPGEWYGPGIASYVVRDLVEIHEQYRHEEYKKQKKNTTTKNNANNSSQQQQQQEQFLEKPLFRVHVASQGSLYKDSVCDLMTRQARSKLEKKRKEEEEQNSTPMPSSPPPSDSFLHPLAFEQITTPDVLTSPDYGELEWDTSLLLFVPLRLGLNTFNETYMKSLAYVFALHQCVGVLGGRPRGARWFYGASSDGEKVYGLDPHTVQYAPARLTANANGQTTSVVHLSEDYIRSIHTTYPEVFPMKNMDPSIALGFYCQNAQDFNHLIRSIQEWNQMNPDLPELFSIADTSPDYAANDSNVMKEMMLSSTSLNADDGMDMPEDLDDEIGGGGEDEDEYVLL